MAKYPSLPASPHLSKDEGLRDTGHSTSIRNLISGVNSVTALYLIHYDSLLQNATGIITECDSYFITKCDRSLLQNASVFLLQNVTDITQCNNYHKFRLYTAPIRLYILTDPLQLKNFPRVFCHFEEISDDFEIRIILIFRFGLD